MHDSDGDARSPTDRSRLTAVVMAGGESRRMGADKAALEVAGAPMLERVVVAARAAGLPVAVVGRARPDWWRIDDVAFIVDRTPGLGPLGGLATALTALDTPVLALACDLPMLTTAAVEWLVSEWRSDPACDALVARRGERLEPLVAVYDRTCGMVAEGLLADGRRAMRDLLAAVRSRIVPVPSSLEDAFANVNTPEALRRANPDG